MTVSKEWLDTEIAERSKEPHRTMYSRTLLDALKELASRRAADEGVVTVEGYADLRVFQGSPWNTLRGAANMMRVFMEGIDGDIPVTVTIRRKP